MINELGDVELELLTNDFMIKWNIEQTNRKLIKHAIRFGSRYVIELKRSEYEEQLDEMYQSELNEQAIKEGESAN